ncbi:competence protein CoiA family protein [Dyadobacter psychrotolerans]|uniref:Competence protein CoiA-like N-terminal domain-containing protein n=1 Tax=Dyadobacter psychrotolerans TaxID=2541721 RepID=A0A4R5D6M5_9BACT|nr:competence protein CoiA family protein [Dyadobacter psychrotolerans]TDE09162.1 hypothetical protein E0F88_30905 [Dyadobacter psychrotolerans]
MNEQNQHDDHSYALNLLDELQHISQVERGRKGYFCPGCRQRMIARKGDIKIHHFAHDPQDVERRGKCSYSDETIRHKLGKEILQHLKHVKVPSLRKYPADGQSGGVQIIRESWTVEADSVAVEMPFYENEEGKIVWGRDLDWKTDSGKFLQIQPDVTFFDETGKPILLIELVATHKISEDKYLKIRNLGIDTIQVSLPTGPSPEIEETFHKTARTKWVYNYERENTEYQHVPPRAGQDISLGDEFEKGLANFERTYECKAFELKEAIRRFRRYLESEQLQALENQSTKKYDELREIQQHIESNGENYRKQLTERSQQDLNQREQDLTRLKLSLFSKEENLKKQTKIWRDDINSKIKALDTKKVLIEQQAKTRLTTLQSEFENWEQTQNLYQIELQNSEQKKNDMDNQLNPKRLILMEKQTLLQKKSQQLTAKSSQLRSKRQDYQMNMQKLKNESELRMNQEKTAFDQNLQNLNKTLEQNLTETENSLLEQLRIEISEEHQDSTEKLKELLKQGDYSTLSLLQRNLKENCEKLEANLIRDLTRNGYRLEDFLNKMK